MLRSTPPSDFLQYLAAPQKCETPESDPAQLPSLQKIGAELGLGVSVLREQLEVARAMGLVEVKPRTGIRRLPYSFLPAVRQSLGYAIELDRAHFDLFADLRNHIEACYWREAVAVLTETDHTELQLLLEKAWEKLRGSPVQIPHEEHRRLHLAIYRRLGNPFVLGILEAYWEAYEAIGLNVYADYGYLQQVWTYHRQMVEAICSGNIEAGHQALVEHKDLLFHRTIPGAGPV
jgi:DNA-binding FadR family transcriptional regulator